MALVRTKLIQARKNLDLTQEELAEKAEISRAYLANIEAGKHDPSLKVASKLATLLKHPVEELFL